MKDSKTTQERISNSPNFINGIAQNIEPTPQITTTHKKRKISMIKLIFDLFIFPNNPKIPSIKEDLKAIKGDHFVWLGHSSYMVHINSYSFLVDPLFSESGSPIAFINTPFKGASPYKLEDLPQIDYLIITHNHYDHLSKHTIKRLAKSGIKAAIAPLGIGKYLQAWGIESEKIIELDWGESTKLESRYKGYLSNKNKQCEIEIFCLTARHFSGRTLKDTNRTLWASYVLEVDDKKLYFSGDGGYGRHFKEIGERFGKIDLAFIENGQYSLDWESMHMFPNQSFQAAKDLNAEIFIPTHNSKYKLSLHAWEEPLELIYSAYKKELNMAQDTLESTNLVPTYILPHLLMPLIGQVVKLWDIEIPNICDTEFCKWWRNYKN